MSGTAADRIFVDTNVLLYAAATAEPAKTGLARRWLDLLWQRSTGRISWQVLNEFYANAERKLRIPATDARKTVRAFSQWQPVGFNLDQIERSWHWMASSGLSYRDALIVASAETLGCRWLLTEDLQHGRRFGVLEVVDPFRSDPASLFPE